MGFPEKLKRMREERNLSQAALGKIIGISRSAIAMYETGEREPDFHTEEALAEYFGVSLDSLREWMCHSFVNSPHAISPTLTPHEDAVIAAYREQPDKQPAVDKLLGVDEDPAIPSPAPVIVRNAALGGGVTRGIATDSPEEAERLQAALENELSGF